MRRRELMLGAAALGGSACFRLARPAEPERPLSDLARQLTFQAWAGLDANEVLDAHVHVVGLGKGGTGCWVNPDLQSPLRHPINAVRFDIYKRAGGVTDDERADAQYVEVLLSRVRRQLVHGRVMLLAFDQTYSEDGVALPALTEFHTPNAYVLDLAKRYPDAFVACASIHPYRPDALDALAQAVEQGAVAVKWLPNAMSIDPSSPRCDRFYDALARLDLPLLTHAGEEKAVEAEDAQRFGNPLHLRRALDRGVRVIVAHCASLGQNPDLDAPQKGWVDNFELFTRLMEEKQYEGRLWGEVSAMTQANRAGRALATVLERWEWHKRLLNGSDYPLPAINVVVQTRVLKDKGFITSEERKALNELDQRNPLQFDFVLKRTLKWRAGGKTHRLSPEVFTARGAFPLLKR
jgi:uncharacterized protein